MQVTAICFFLQCPESRLCLRHLYTCHLKSQNALTHRRFWFSDAFVLGSSISSVRGAFDRWEVMGLEVSQVCLKLDCSHQQNILPSFSTRNISASSKFDRLGLGWVQQSSYRGALECPERLLLHSLLKEILVQINLLYRSNRNLTINFQNCSIHRKSCAAQKIFLLRNWNTLRFPVGNKITWKTEVFAIYSQYFHFSRLLLMDSSKISV